MKSFLLSAARIGAWSLAVIVTILSVVPPWLRPETETPHGFEHFTAFFVTGVAFGFGYSRKPVTVGSALVLFAAAIEIVQIFVPGRHSRLNDFIVDALAASVGVAVGFFAAKRAVPQNPKATDDVLNNQGL